MMKNKLFFSKFYTVYILLKISLIFWKYKMFYIKILCIVRNKTKNRWEPFLIGLKYFRAKG